MQGSIVQNLTSIKWKTILGLALIAVGTWFNWSWIWGVLFLIWGVTDLVYQETYLIERITRSENPVLYALVVTTWLMLSFFSFFPNAW